jgi:hypothetical protein
LIRGTKDAFDKCRSKNRIYPPIEARLPACQCDLRRPPRWNLCSKGRRMDLSDADAFNKFSLA